MDTTSNESTGYSYVLTKKVMVRPLLAHIRPCHESMSALCQKRTLVIYLYALLKTSPLSPTHSILTGFMINKTRTADIQNFISQSGIIWAGTRQHQCTHKMGDGIYQVSARAIFSS
ncbi:hypothetical protein ACVLVH_000133 [Kluyvera sp. 1366]